MTDAVAGWKPGIVLQPIDLTPVIIMAIKAQLSPAQALSLTAWAEARSRFENGHWVGNPLEAMADIVNVVDNRAKDKRWKAIGHKGACLSKWQFSCWEPKGGPDDPRDADQLAENFETIIYAAQRMLAGVQPTGMLFQCLAVAEGCLAGSMVDTLSGATHYWADWIAPPDWAVPPAREVAYRYGHHFWAGVG